MPLTDTKLRALRTTGVRFELPDRDGLAFRVGSNGSMTWLVTYTVRGAGQAAGVRVSRLTSERQRLTIGVYPDISLSEARERAASIRRLARSGTDPRPAASVADVPPSAGPATVTELLARYVQEHLARNLSSGANVQRLLQHHVIPSWGGRALAELGVTDLVELLERVRVARGALVCATGQAQCYAALRGGPGAAIEVRKWVRAMFQFAVACGLMHSNPFTNVRNRDKVHSRERYLDMDEVRAVWRAAGRMYYPWSALFRLLLLTGARRSEWAEARWEWLDGRVSRLEIPAREYKTGRPHVLPFGTQVRGLVRGLPKGVLGPFLLSSDGGERPVSGFSKAKAQLDELVARELRGRCMTPWVLHDLRRSMATHMERLGVLPHVIEACLGHTLRGVAGTYRHYNHFDEKQTALQLWADELEGLQEELADMDAAAA